MEKFINDLIWEEVAPWAQRVAANPVDQAVLLAWFRRTTRTVRDGEWELPKLPEAMLAEFANRNTVIFGEFALALTQYLLQSKIWSHRTAPRGASRLLVSLAVVLYRLAARCDASPPVPRPRSHGRQFVCEFTHTIT